MRLIAELGKTKKLRHWRVIFAHNDDRGVVCLVVVIIVVAAAAAVAFANE